MQGTLLRDRRCALLSQKKNGKGARDDRLGLGNLEKKQRACAENCDRQLYGNFYCGTVAAGLCHFGGHDCAALHRYDKMGNCPAGIGAPAVVWFCCGSCAHGGLLYGKHLARFWCVCVCRCHYQLHAQMGSVHFSQCRGGRPSGDGGGIYRGCRDK